MAKHKIPAVTPDGKPIKPKPGQKPKPKPKPSTGGGGSGGGGGYSGGGGGYSGGSGGSGGSSAPAKPKLPPGAITEAQKAVVKRNLPLAYNNLFPPGSKRAVPDALMKYAQRMGMDDAAFITRWMRDTKFKLYEKTTDVVTRGKEAGQQLDVIFGENNKLKAAYVKTYMWGAEMTWNDFLDKKVVNSAAFAKEYPGYKAWRNLPANKHNDNATSITKFSDLRNAMDGWYKEAMGDAGATMSNAVFSQAMGQNIQDKTVFDDWVRTSLPEYTGGTGGSEASMSKASEFDDLWSSIYGGDSAPDPKMKDAWKRSASDANINDFFNNVIRKSDQFRQAEPDFEAWANAVTGEADASNTHVNATGDGGFFEERQALRDQYDILTEGKGLTNDVLIQKAIRGRWSAARLELEFKNSDPNYEGTADYVTKQEDLNAYWGGIFGPDSKPPNSIEVAYVRGNSTDVTTMFDYIKQTAEFQTQYGNWAEFQTAQDYAGNSTKILRDPAMYKQYQDTFNQAFAAVGIEPPPEFEKRMFASGVDPSTLESNLNDYTHTNQSYNTWTGEQADLATASGIGDATKGGDLRNRMKQALEAHKAYAGSEFATTEKKQNSGFSTQNI